ncbi:small multidrug resistance protein [Alcanivorax sp. S71-1-4]|jgi:quaternary ammonium compound-resistance protein SugE|uniref:DMT family transporter n=1 Tax=Alcanivorax sp. S71-1-4 TaxID=1177159 RepID=UPI00135C3FD5|nr:multidrug efflux SMR transporter [Alcanivorax sp. S71-1-4]KAF0810339.1 small multidrug resistance protein [Alcanivorax sp. S71-1-4]
MPWILLSVAGLLEVVWAVGLKRLDAEAPLLLWFGVVSALLGSVALLALAMRDLPLSLAYPLWVGIGLLGSVLAGMLLFGESVSPLKWASLALIALGMLGLKAL